MEEVADVAQLVEQLIRNQQVSGSIPLVGSISTFTHEEWRPSRCAPATLDRTKLYRFRPHRA
jgi:hypothetical protein